MLSQLLHGFTLLGEEWVLWILIGLSVVSVGVMIERFVFFMSNRLPGAEELERRLAQGDAEYARRATLSDSAVGPQEAVRAEAGLVSGQARVALGYNLVGFGGDGLTPATDTGRLYLRAQVSY